MKTNPLLTGLGIFLVLFAISCGGSSDNYDSASKEEKGSQAEDAKMESAEATEEGYNKDLNMPAADVAAEEEATEAPEEKKFFKNEDDGTQGGITKVFSSSAAVTDPDDTLHKFIRTADIRFKVNQVTDATYRIEDITRKFKGFVSYTNLVSRIDRTSHRVISKDSILETTYFTVENTITIRVPSKNLDTTLKEIAKLVDYLDYRVISANDVRLSLLANKLEKRRLARYNARLSKISDAGGSNYMDDKTYIEENLLQKMEQADNTLIEDLTLEDQIEYSTVTLALYQNQEMKNELLANEENIEEYKPGMGSRMLDSLKIGWNFIEDAIVGLVAAWPLYIILFMIYVLLRKNGYLKGKKKEEV
jgi:hypothetical protein